MPRGTKSLNAAGVREPGLREDYDRQRQLVRRFRRTAYLAARLLLPRPLLAHVVAATAVMHHGDNILDTAPLSQRAGAGSPAEPTSPAGIHQSVHRKRADGPGGGDARAVVDVPHMGIAVSGVGQEATEVRTAPEP
ncbi:hypothetical protein ABZX95_12585 [Streptomyces sp. NPDC004232]|uniref:hypothetical protein n=1 Tax=Streptomyces sp. NPDC004232 TaxID=3154454 RepID=UPI0033B75A5E